MAITLDGTDGITTTGLISNGNAVITTQSPQLGRRNLIINGAMQVAQRATQVTGFESTGYTTCDRFILSNTTLGAWTVDQSTDAPDGFGSSFKVTCTTADSSPAAGDRFFMYQIIEAQNLQQLAYGTSNAKNLTLSFWVKSNKTGTASIDALQNDNSLKMFSNTYTINSADTWEYKTISIPADTTGVIDNDTGSGFQINFWMNSGTSYTGGGITSGWESFDNTKRNPSNLGVGGTTSDYFAITGVQLEVGDVATPFEHRSYGEELALCQRYFYRAADGATKTLGLGVNYTSSQMFGVVYFPVTMRAIPTLNSASGTNYYEFLRNGGADYFNTLVLGNRTTVNIGEIYNSTEISGTVGHGGWIRTDSAAVYVDFDAEL